MSISDGALRSVPRATLREGALAQIRDAILAGHLKPGTPLGEVAVSEQLGVSRGTVRESFRTLQQEGLIEPFGRGLRVKLMTGIEIEELFLVRAELESLAIEQVLQRDDKDELVEAIAEQLPPGSEAKLTYAQRLDRDLAFHRALVRSSGIGLLIRMWTNLENSARVVVLAHQNSDVVPYMGRDHHSPIVEAMRNGDAAAARTALQSHMRASAKFFAE
ncbi:GntR family transcriptional regulator [Brevibacterium sp.]|uniref:GntR family transcriptional regulator n=1 Tax=Brevibacterium sp. TaxID=1701 RepID=UPI0028119A1A|nr:GntR family transcriptional regulator [Brevibacterium sp.]